MRSRASATTTSACWREARSYARFSAAFAAPGDGAELGAANLGLTLRQCSGKDVQLKIPAPLSQAVSDFAPDSLLWTDYPETEGRTAYPFHTKARNLARLLVRRERLASFDLSQPLQSAIDFAAPEATQRRFDERLARVLPKGKRLCVISRAGVTAARKNWGDGSEARAFVAAFQRRASPWIVISMDDEDLGENVFGFRRLFADAGEPFGRLLRALAARTDLFVGVPAGPLHFMLARGGVAVVGLWTAHHPDWYDEPNPNSIHVVGRYVRDRGFDRRVATTSKPPALRHRFVLPGYRHDRCGAGDGRGVGALTHVSTEVIVLPPERTVPCKAYSVAEMRSNVTAMLASG